MAMAENSLMHHRLLPRLLSDLEVNSHMLTYHDGTTGSNRLKSAMSTFLSKHLATVTPIEPDHVTITNGCCSAIEQLAWAMADPDEAFLVGRPYFRAFLTTLGGRMHVKTLPVAFAHSDPFGTDAAAKYEAALLEARERGQKTKGLILCNPHNPTGRCYPRETIVQLMRLCQKYQIHLISDEIYALSTWGSDDTFYSCLSIDTTGIIDPSLVHVVWGTSKDFGINGLRIGAVISQHNPELHEAISVSSIHSSPSSLSEVVVANILNDTEWVEQFIEENRQRLAQRFSLGYQWAKTRNIPVSPGTSAAFFLWVDLATAYKERHPGQRTEDVVRALAQALMDHKVLASAGESFGAELPGWYRIVFTLPEHELHEGLRRIEMALNS